MTGDDTAPESAQPSRRTRSSPRAPGQVVACGWCGQEVAVPARGRVPKWCSPTCRHRAWEQARAAASGRAAVEVRDRTIETVRTRSVVEHHRVEVPTLHRPRAAQDFATVLADLARMLDDGRLYDRDLPTLLGPVQELVEAFNRRQQASRRPQW